MSNKKRISRKRAQLKDVVHVTKSQVAEFIPMMINIAEAAKKAALDLSGISPRMLEGMMAFEIDNFGKQKSVFAGSRDYIK